MYKIIQDFNENTKLAVYDNTVYVLKKIALEDISLFKMLIPVNHINIVRVYGFTEIDGAFYAVQEYIQGVTLEKYLQLNGALSEETTRNIALAICSALIQIHSLGIIHRDITPNNIMIDNYGVVKVIDFGISRVQKAYQNKDTHILGTYGFAAPEQFGFSQTSAKTDIYSLGILINYMLTLKLPNERIADNYFTPIIMKCVEIDVEKRYDDVELLMKDIERRRTKHNFIRGIPGFQKNVQKYKVLSVSYYIFCALVIGITLDMNKSLKYRILTCIWILFYFVFPVFTACDFMYYLERLPFTKHCLPKSRKSWAAFFTFLSFFIGTIFIIISPLE